MFVDARYLLSQLGLLFQVISTSFQECKPISNDELRIAVDYNAVSDVTQLKALTTLSTYCTQELVYGCMSEAPLQLDDRHGWYTLDNVRVPYWSGNTGLCVLNYNSRLIFPIDMNFEVDLVEARMRLNNDSKDR